MGPEVVNVSGGGGGGGHSIPLRFMSVTIQPDPFAQNNRIFYTRQRDGSVITTWTQWHDPVSTWEWPIDPDLKVSEGL